MVATLKKKKKINLFLFQISFLEKAQKRRKECKYFFKNPFQGSGKRAPTKASPRSINGFFLTFCPVKTW